MQHIKQIIIFTGIITLIFELGYILEYFFPGRYDIGIFSALGIFAIWKIIEVTIQISNYNP